MQRILFILFFVFSLNKVIYAQEKITIAVMDLKGEGLSTSETRIITSRLRTDLFNTKKFKVVEREKMNEILEEQGFQLSGCTSNECIIEAGKLLGARRIVAGEIGRIGNLFTLSIRIIDVETGEILRTATEDCECRIEEVITKSISKVAQILSGSKVYLSSYHKGITSSVQQKNSPSIIQPWEKAGLKREEYVAYKRSAKSFEDWYDDFISYKESIKNPFATAIKSAIIPGWGQLTMHKYRGYLYLAYDIIITGTKVYFHNNGERAFARSMQLPIHLLVNRIISSIDAGITSVYYNADEKNKFFYGMNIKKSQISNYSRNLFYFAIAF